MATVEASAIPAEAAPARGSARRWGGQDARTAPRQGGGAVYGIGMIGALVYFLGSAESPSDYALGLGKAVVWPALLVYRAFRALDG
jgi:hypothetical protein